jgi:hypothetical protein
MAANLTQTAANFNPAYAKKSPGSMKSLRAADETNLCKGHRIGIGAPVSDPARLRNQPFHAGSETGAPASAEIS